MADIESLSGRPEALGFQSVREGQKVELQAPRTDYYAASNAISVPFSLEGGRPLVHARLNDVHDGVFVVDTGASFTSLAGRSAVAAHVRTIHTNYFPAQLARGVGGTERILLGLIDRMSLGGLHMTNLAVNVRLEETKSSGSGSGAPRNSNLLGLRPILAGSAYVTVDYPRRMLTVSPREEFRPPASGTGSRPVLQVPFTVTEQDLRISLGFSNGRRADFLVDTGYDGELLMSTSTTEYAGLDTVVRRGRQGAVRGIGGEMMQIAFTVDWIEMGGRRFGYVKASTGTQLDLIGSGWLRQFRVTFDFRRRLMWLE